MARHLGVSRNLIREWMVEFPEFPARRGGKNGKWLTTERALNEWLYTYVTTPDANRDPYAPEPVERKRRSHKKKIPPAAGAAEVEKRRPPA